MSASAANRYRDVRAQLDSVCREQGRNPSEVLLVAVSKTVGSDAVAQAFEAGAADFGENRPDDLLSKAAALPQANWHFIGNLQSRRIPDVVAHACLIHSVFKADHLAKIDRAAAAVGKVQRILVEVNVSGEETKGGVAPHQMEGLLQAAQGLDHLQVVGLMTMAPAGDASVAGACFAGLRQLRDQLNEQLPQARRLTELSMGMSDDWHEAVAQGATIVRVGRAVFPPQ